MQNDRNRSLPEKSGHKEVPVATLEVAYKQEKGKVNVNWMRAAILLFIFSKILVITIALNNWKVKRLEQDVATLKNEIKQIKIQQEATVSQARAVLATAHD